MGEHFRGEQNLTRVNNAQLLAEPPVKLLGSVLIRQTTRVGAFTELGNNVEIQHADIGRYCEVAPGGILGATGHPRDWLSVSAFQYKAATWGWHPSAKGTRILDPEADGRTSFRGVRGEEPTIIGDDVWLGANVVVLKGVHVGTGSIVAANAVVTADVPPYSIVGGTPAKLIRPRFPSDLVEQLLDVAWWRFSPAQLSGLPFDDPAAAVTLLRERIADGLEPYAPERVSMTRPAAKPAPAPAATSFPQRVRNRLRH